MVFFVTALGAIEGNRDKEAVRRLVDRDLMAGRRGNQVSVALEVVNKTLRIALPHQYMVQEEVLDSIAVEPKATIIRIRRIILRVDRITQEDGPEEPGLTVVEMADMAEVAGRTLIPEEVEEAIMGEVAEVTYESARVDTEEAAVGDPHLPVLTFSR
jgi:hypothetical protein